MKISLENRQLIQYLQQELGIADSEIAVVTRTQQPSITELPILLWNQGLIDLEKLGQIFDWME
ncbi:MAG TPA: DUF2949 domain-containing protein, partial [Stenomitos sp.]